MKKEMRKIGALILMLAVLLLSGCGGRHVDPAEVAKVWEPVHIETDADSRRLLENGMISYTVTNGADLAELFGVSADLVRQMQFTLYSQDTWEPAAADVAVTEKVALKDITCAGYAFCQRDVVCLDTQNFSKADVFRPAAPVGTVHHTLEGLGNVDGTALAKALGWDVLEEKELWNVQTVSVETGASVRVMTIPVCQLYHFEVVCSGMFGKTATNAGCIGRVIGFCTVVCGV